MRGTPALKPGTLSQYLIYMESQKVVQETEIRFGPKRSNKHWTECRSVVLCTGTVVPTSTLLISRRVDGSKYGVGLEAKSLCVAPCFRFDSAGPSHENRYPDIPLLNRIVATPHFQRFDESGRWIAHQPAQIVAEEDLLRTEV